jgi:hypothetical protein
MVHSDSRAVANYQRDPLLSRCGRKGAIPNCSICGGETSLYLNGQPICLKCDEERERRLKDRLIEKWELEHQRTTVLQGRDSG